MYLGYQNDQSETIDTEYKEFCIKNNVFNFYTSDEIEDIIYTGNIMNQNTFNDMIINNLQLYFDMYVPKYASSFCNTSVKNGTLNIGINDFGEITGIPFFGDISLLNIDNMISKSKNKFLNKSVNTISSINKLKINKTLIEDNTDSFLKNVNEQNYKNSMIEFDFFQKRKEWVNEVLLYSVKLSEIISNKETRFHFYNWIKIRQDCPIIQICLTVTPEEIESIHFKRQYITDKNHVIYWIAKFKDHSMNFLQSNKPTQIMHLKKVNGPLNLFIHLSNMRAKFIDNNSDLNYYTISIKFNNNFNTKDVFYKKHKNNYSYKSIRKENIFGPYCITQHV